MDIKEFLLQVKNLEIVSFELIEDQYILIKTICGSHYKISDTKQSCCEVRWMTCDDDLSLFSGCRILDVEVLDCGSSIDVNDMEDDLQFVRIVTNLGDFRCCNHNRHNGYYGGFDVCFERLK